MLARKLYISGLVALLGLGAVVMIVSVVITAHDALHYQALPQPFRLAINKLQDGWHYAGLPEDQQEAILAQHKKWKDQEKLPWWGSSEIVDPDAQKAETLANFQKFVPRWGLRMNQQRPFLALGVSLLAFVPAIVFLYMTKWIGWLRSPNPVAG